MKDLTPNRPPDTPAPRHGELAHQRRPVAACREQLRLRRAQLAEPARAGHVARVARVDVNKNGKGCHVAWTSDERAPSVVPKASLATGLIYTYTNPPSTAPDDPWYWTAIDFRTGKTAYKVLAGNGSAWNNHYAAVNISPKGTAYLGGFPGGLWSLKDGS